MTFRIHALTALAVLTLAAVSAVAPPHVISERAVVSHPGYWTAARMAKATAASRGVIESGAPWRGGGEVVKTTGREFFTLDGVDYSCSGSVVGGPDPDMIVTAAHCVSDGAGGWASDWTFVPGYASGTEPYGSFPARTFYVPSQWSSGGGQDGTDVAFVALRQARADGAMRSVASVVGSQPIAFGVKSKYVTVFGYPAEAPYTGNTLEYCRGPVHPNSYGAAAIGIDCALTEGDSGGPWLSGFDARTGTGTITGVTSFRYSGGNSLLYAATLGSVARGLYHHAEHG